MRFVVQRDTLIRELDILRPLFGACENIKISAKDGRFTAVSTDNWSWLTTGGEAAVIEAGSITVRGNHFLSLVKLLSKGEVTLESRQSDTLKLQSSDFSANLLCPLFLPSAPDFTQNATFTLNGKQLLDMIGQTQGVLRDDVAVAKNALLCLYANGQRMVSADGHRLAVTETVAGEGEAKQILLAKKVVAHIKQMLDGYRGDVQVEHSTDGKLLFTVGHRVLLTKYDNSKFPDYERVLKLDLPVRVTFNAAEVIAATRRMVFMLRKPDDAVVNLTISTDTLRIAINGNKEDGEASETLSATIAGGADFSFNLKAEYLIDAVATAGSEQVTMRCVPGGTSPVSIHPTDKLTTFVVMPIRSK